MICNNLNHNSLKCEHRACNCTQYIDSSTNKRICDSCKHSWVLHAISKMGCRSLLYTETEQVDLDSMHEIASLMLYGAQAIPVRLKILLDRILVSFGQEDLCKILAMYGWSLQDYSRGYILMTTKSSLSENKLILASREEEAIVIQQFLRFTETRQIAQQFLLDFGEMPSLKQPVKQTANKTSATSLKIKQELPSPKSTSSASSDINLHNARETSSPASIQCKPPSMPQTQNAAAMTAAAAAAAALGYPPSTAAMFPFMFAANRNILNDLHSHPSGGPRSTPMDAMQNFPYFPFAAAAAASRTNPAAMAAFYNQSSHLNPEFWFKNLQQQQQIQQQHQQHQQQQHHQFQAQQHQQQQQQQPQLNGHIEGKENSHTKQEPIVKAPKVIKPKKVKQEVAQVAAVAVTAAAAAASTPQQHSYELENEQKMFSIENNDTNASFSSSSNQNTSSSGSKKRRPDLSQQGILVSPNGKKRVQCHVCLKTFCDKGALKIHFSAVHLREMHKCSVEGCNMVFSSRRSRNRHSANPNPKLHMSRPHPISHRYPTTGPIISEDRPSMASAFLVDVDKPNGGDASFSADLSQPVKIEVGCEDDESMMSSHNDLESNRSESPSQMHHHHQHHQLQQQQQMQHQQSQLKLLAVNNGSKRKSSNPMRISLASDVNLQSTLSEKRKYSNDDQNNEHNQDASLQKRSKCSSSHSSAYSQSSSSRSSSPQQHQEHVQNEQPLNFSMHKQQPQLDHQESYQNESEDDYDEVNSDEDDDYQHEQHQQQQEQHQETNYNKYCSNTNQIPTSS